MPGEYGPVCLDHGIMHLDTAAGYWLCHGYDGEGCPAKIPSEVAGPVYEEIRQYRNEEK